jgi:hypothetical protein
MYIYVWRAHVTPNVFIVKYKCAFACSHSLVTAWLLYLLLHFIFTQVVKALPQHVRELTMVQHDSGTTGTQSIPYHALPINSTVCDFFALLIILHDRTQDCLSPLRCALEDKRLPDPTAAMVLYTVIVFLHVYCLKQDCLIDRYAVRYSSSFHMLELCERQAAANLQVSAYIASINTCCVVNRVHIHYQYLQ